MEAMNSLKNALISEPIEDYPNKHRPYSLISDAFTGRSEINGGLEAILCQTDQEGEERVIAYKQTTPVCVSLLDLHYF
jgi:hypothetical protein